MSYPVLLPRETWYRGAQHDRTHFKTIRFLDSYSPGEDVTVDESWNAAESGTITCYAIGDELIVAGDGSGMIAANADSSYMMGPKVTSLDSIFTFKNVKHIYGAELLDMTAVTNLEGAFHYMLSLQFMETGKWELPNVNSLYRLFFSSPQTEGCPIGQVDLSGNSLENVTTTRQMFNNCKKLKKVNLKGVKLTNVENMAAMFGNCASLEELDLSGVNNEKASGGMSGAFLGMSSLKKISVGKNFSFYTGVPDNPSSEYIEGADGKWHTLRGDSYAPESLPSNRVVTYYASTNLVDEVLDTPVIIPGRTALGISDAIREKAGSVDDLKPSEYEAAIREI